MPAQTNLVLNDGKATPVAHTFVPDGALRDTNGKVVADWVDRSPPSKIGFWTIKEQHTPSNVNGVEKLRWVLNLPVLESLSNTAASGIVPSPTKAFDDPIIAECWTNDRASLAQKKDKLAIFRAFVNSTYFEDKVINGSKTF